MLRKAMEYLQELAKPNTIEHAGELFSDKELKPVVFNPAAKPILLSTLRSLVMYCLSNADKLDEEMFIHIQSPTKVMLYSTLDKYRTRECLAIAEAQLPNFSFDSFIDHENFCIGLQSKFEPDGDRDLLLKFAGTVESGTITEYGDDGVSQKATIKNGISGKQDAIVPNPVTLRPYRTFLDVEQPSSQFIFRMSNNRGVSCALFEADGGAWKNTAMDAIERYLTSELHPVELAEVGIEVERTKFIILR